MEGDGEKGNPQIDVVSPSYEVNRKVSKVGQGKVW